MGLGWSFLDDRNYAMGVSIGYSGGRSESSSSYLKGLGDVGKSADIGMFGSFRYKLFDFRLSGMTAANNAGHGGSTVNTSVGLFIPVSEKVRIMGNIGATWASASYMQTMFGVTTQQSIASGLKTYQAGSGIKDIGGRIGIDFSIDKNVSFNLGYGYKALKGDAADSPIVVDRNQHTVNAGLAYKW